MGFDISKFETTTFKHREVVIPVPEFAVFFGEEDKPEWTVRGLTGPELAQVNDAVATNKNVEGVLEAIAGHFGVKDVDVLKGVVGLPAESENDDLVRRFNMLALGSVTPECPHKIAVKMGQTFPRALYRLTNEIIQLTGLGMVGE